MTMLPRRTPRSAGVDANGIAGFLDDMSKSGIELHSCMIVRRGSVVFEHWWAPYDPQTPHLLYSLSKSFTAVAAGIAEAEGLLKLDDRLSDHLDETAHYGEATIADALRMSVGHLLDPVLDPTTDSGEMNDVALRAILRDYSPERKPGEVFTYDQLATFAVAKIIEARSGTSLLEYLRPRLLAPLGAAEAKWYGGEANPGLTGLYLCTESIAAFGQLLLQEGEWGGEQLVPRDWLRRATSTQMYNDSAHRFPPDMPVDRDSGLGYGYQFWIGDHGYHAGGAYGQFCLVLPGSDAVVAVTASTQAGQPVLDAVWEHLLPAFAADVPGDEVTAAADLRLAKRFADATVVPPVAGVFDLAACTAKATLGQLAVVTDALRGGTSSDLWHGAAAHASEWTERAVEAIASAAADPVPLVDPICRDVSTLTFTRAARDASLPHTRFGGLGDIDMPELTAVRLSGNVLTLTLEEGLAHLAVEPDRWQRGVLPGEIPIPFTTRGGWAGDGRFEVELRMIEGPHVGYLLLDPETEEFSFIWREPTLAGRGLAGYRA
ncbi:serine hydrolase domain-containing protein [Microbacterium arabinogalactanolyticum]|uniref:serine hydrolase domain-containing protein n=1 Tax=Microbacterium arabinogalactanolyticum TaxID=69365 RepID=UPI004043FC16